MARPQTKEDLITAAEDNYDKLMKLIASMSEPELNTEFDFSADVKKKEAHWSSWLKPLKLCFKDQAWYLYAYCCLRKDYRFFKLKRMSEIQSLDTTFEPEMIGRILPDASKTYSDNTDVVRVTLEISQDMAFRAYEELPEIQVTDHGDLVSTVDVTDINWFISYVLSYGSHMRVLEPTYMKEKVKQEIEKMNQAYKERV